MKTVLVLALGEIREGLRNRWVAASIVLLATLAFALSALGSAPTGTVNAHALSVSVASLSSLSVYLVPLIALMLVLILLNTIFRPSSLSCCRSRRW